MSGMGTLSASLPRGSRRGATTRKGILSAVLSPAGVVLRAVLVIFMIAPVLCIAVLSFGQEQTLEFPPQSWGVGLYTTFFHSGYWITALLTSLKIGLPAALLAVVVGTPVCWVLSRGMLPFKSGLQILALSPLILPAIAFAIALYGMYLRFNVLYTDTGLILADATLGIPFVLLIVKAALDRIPAELELVAMSLGAKRPRAVLEITLRLLGPAVFASFIMSFMVSFDEATLVQFLGGPGQTTLPKAIFDSARTGFQPVILAIATILEFGTGILIVTVGKLRGSRAVRADV